MFFVRSIILGGDMIYFVEEIDLKSNIHPVTGEKYLDNSIIFLLEDNDSPDVISCKNDNGIYTVRMGLGNAHWEMAVGDFVSYAKAEQLEAVMCIDGRRLCQAREVYAGHYYNDRQLRCYEPGYLVHSTAYDSGKRILNDGSLKCWNRLKEEGQMAEKVPIGRDLGDPDFFSDYIMFSGGEVSSEIVVMSRQTGEIIMDVNRKYQTGMRFYFDAAKMAEDGILLRDGIHVKVKGELPLERYLMWRGDWRNVGLESQVSTPQEFTDRANGMFEKLGGEQRCKNCSV